MLLDLTQLRNLEEPARSWRWRLIVPDGTGGYSNELLAETVSFPNINIGMVQRQAAAGYKHYPDFRNIQQLHAVFYEGESYQTCNWLFNWRQQVVDDQGNYGLPAFYKRNCILMMFSLKSSVSPSMILQLEGCWPMAAPEDFNLNYTDSGFFTPSAIFAVDKVIQQL